MPNSGILILFYMPKFAKMGVVLKLMAKLCAFAENQRFFQASLAQICAMTSSIKLSTLNSTLLSKFNEKAQTHSKQAY